MTPCVTTEVYTKKRKQIKWNKIPELVRRDSLISPSIQGRKKEMAAVY